MLNALFLPLSLASGGINASTFHRVVKEVVIGRFVYFFPCLTAAAVVVDITCGTICPVVTTLAGEYAGFFLLGPLLCPVASTIHNASFWIIDHTGNAPKE